MSLQGPLVAAERLIFGLNFFFIGRVVFLTSRWRRYRLLGIISLQKVTC
jgi:hypothetical protein